MCQVLQVSEAGDYRWLRNRTRPHQYDDLLAKIRQIRAENKDYGAFCIYLALQLFHGYTGTYYVILKLCKIYQLMLKKKYHAKGITNKVRLKNLHLTPAFFEVSILQTWVPAIRTDLVAFLF